MIKKDFFSYKTMTEIENIVCENPDFLRVDRGTIINLAKIDSFDNKNIMIMMRNGKKLFLNKNKMKEIKGKISEAKMGFVLGDL